MIFLLEAWFSISFDLVGDYKYKDFTKGSDYATLENYRWVVVYWILLQKMRKFSFVNLKIDCNFVAASPTQLAPSESPRVGTQQG